jgi:hypothetical protein
MEKHNKPLVDSYWSNLYEGSDGKPSIRRVLAIFFCTVFTFALFTNYSTDKLTIVAGLIVGLLSLTTAQNIFGGGKNIE